MKTTPMMVSSSNHTAEMMKNYVRGVMRCRKKSLETMEKIANLLSKKTYYAKEKVSTALSSAVKPSLLLHQMDDDILDSFLSLEKSQSEISECILPLNTMLQSDAETTFEKSHLEKVIGQFQQQLLIESSIAESLAKYSDQKIEQDDLTTMVACFKYAPYIRTADIEALMNLK